jgi:hypothetical protein
MEQRRVRPTATFKAKKSKRRQTKIQTHKYKHSNTAAAKK